jgi:hypothetical protein
MTMAKRPSLFATPPKPVNDSQTEETAPLPEEMLSDEPRPGTRPPPSRAGKRALTVYLDPVAWRQLRDLALDLETSTQALGIEAVNLLFEKHRLNRSA